MADLKQMLQFLDETGKTVNGIHKKFVSVQEFFNRNYNNVNSIRNEELEFLQDEFFADSGRFPREIRKAYESGLKAAEASFTENLNILKGQKSALGEKLKSLDTSRLEYARTLKESNLDLDRKEEKIKAGIAELEEKILDYNRTIGEMATGFGFFTNIFRMRTIEKEKKELLARRTELVERIEAVRNQWVQAEKDLGGKDAEIQNTWTNLQTEFALLTEKIGTLEKNRDILIQKSAFYEALNTLSGREKYIELKASGTPADTCPACGSKNENNLFFCKFCGSRFAVDRPDLEGSLVETGELNQVYTDLTEGIRESVSLIALMRGLQNGINTFVKSVKSVKESQDKFTQLPKLQIDVPGASAGFADKLKSFEKDLDVTFYNLHPRDFVQAVKKAAAGLLTAENIEKFFTPMGDELNIRTKEQWK